MNYYFLSKTKDVPLVYINGEEPHVTYTHPLSPPPPPLTFALISIRTLAYFAREYCKRASFSKGNLRKVVIIIVHFRFLSF